MPDLSTLHKLLINAKSPEEVYGPLTGRLNDKLAQMKTIFRSMALIAHPDRSLESPTQAARTFQLLETWRIRAEERIRNGTYGTANPSHGATPITTRKGTYIVHEPLLQGDYYTLYRCTRTDRTTSQNLNLKIVRDFRDNDLLERETDTLRMLTRGDATSRRYFPEIVDAFLSSDGSIQRRALILGIAQHAIPLTDIPSGLDPRDAAWIFNRILEALWFTHQNELIHGDVLPPNLYVDVENHGLQLLEWAFAASPDKPISALCSSYFPWYPTEVLRKLPATSATDILMATRCLIYLLGGDPMSGSVPPTVPSSLQRFIKACILPAAARRPSDAGELREEFDACLAQLYGKRTFRSLAIPV